MTDHSSRLTGYLYPFREASGAFLEGAAIEHASTLYVFDKKLRLLVLDAIERTEVAVRVEIALLLGARDPLAHLNPRLLDGNFSKKLSPDSGKTKHLANWLAHINLLRNIAAHHGRLWNRKLELRPSF